MKRHNIAILLAGGKGTRLMGNVPKQFAIMDDNPMISYSLNTFQQHNKIDEIILVLPEDCIETINQYIDLKKYTKISGIISGGKERCVSTKAALDFIKDNDAYLLFHDVARPLISPTIIDAVLLKLKTFQAVCTAIPTTDTILQIDDNQNITKYLPRNCCYAAQTPQAFLCSVIRKAFELAALDTTFFATDDCSVLHRYLPEIPIAIVIGERINMKITYPEDFTIATVLLQK